MNEQEYILCDVCGNRIYKEDETHYGDDYYRIDGLNICPDCLREYMNQNYRRTA